MAHRTSFISHDVPAYRLALDLGGTEGPDGPLAMILGADPEASEGDTVEIRVQHKSGKTSIRAYQFDDGEWLSVIPWDLRCKTGECRKVREWWMPQCPKCGKIEAITPSKCFPNPWQLFNVGERPAEE